MNNFWLNITKPEIPLFNESIRYYATLGADGRMVRAGKPIWDGEFWQISFEEKIPEDIKCLILTLQTKYGFTLEQTTYCLDGVKYIEKDKNGYLYQLVGEVVGEKDFTQYLVCDS